MSWSLLGNWCRWSGKAEKPKNRLSNRRRCLAVESLENRALLSASSLMESASLNLTDPLSINGNTGDKPQSKVWRYADHWWSAMPNESGTWLWRLDEKSWTGVLRLSPEKDFQTDVKAVDDLAHILLFDGSDSKFVSLEYLADGSDSYQFWRTRPELVDLEMDSNVETATIDIDSTGRLWLASDTRSEVEVRYSEYPYKVFSDPISLVTGITSDDISVVTSMPNGNMGVLWSDQNMERFGFRLHADSADPQSWESPEVPAAESAMSEGSGMADDHLNVVVTSDGTLYAAVKTGYDKKNLPEIGLLVRHPSGVWDSIYSVDTKGTRPIVLANEDEDRLLVVYTESDGGGDILFKESSLNQIAFSEQQKLLEGNFNNATSSKQVFGDQLLVMASHDGSATGVKIVSRAPGTPSLVPTAAPLTSELDVEKPSWKTVSFQDGLDGYTGTRDTRIEKNKSDINFGVSSSLKADGSPDRATLIKWDLSSIPPGSSILSVSLSVYDSNRSSHGYELYKLEQGWVEIETTWKKSAIGQPWQVAGAKGSDDRGSIVLGTLKPSSKGLHSLDLNTSGLAVIESWIDQPESNHGLIVQDYTQATDGFTLDSRESTTIGNRPKLTISYRTDDRQGNEARSIDVGPKKIPTDFNETTLGIEAESLPFSEKQTVKEDLGDTAGQPLGLWQLDSKDLQLAVDDSALGHHGTIYGNPGMVQSPTGYGLNFDGKKDRILIVDSPTLETSGGITLSAWLRPEKRKTQYVIKKGHKDTVDGYELSLSSNGKIFVRFNQESSSNSYRLDSTTRYPTDGKTWIHVAATYDGLVIKFYAGGELESSRSASFQIADNDLDLCIGAQDNGYRPMQGGIDEVRVYPEALSADQIKELITS